MGGDYMVMGSLGSSSTKVAVDTSALITLCEGQDFFRAVETEFGKVKYVVPTSVIEELKKLSRDNSKYARCYNLVNKIIERNSMSVVYTGNSKYADADFLDMQADLFVTNDMELAKKLYSQNKKVFILKKNRYYDYYP